MLANDTFEIRCLLRGPPTIMPSMTAVWTVANRTITAISIHDLESLFACRTFLAEEAIDVKEAIRVYTINGAYIGKDEDSLGSIEPGKFADIIVLDRDILSIDPEDILNVKVLKTFSDGKIVYET